MKPLSTQLFIDDQGRILGKHQKLVPTVGERLVHTGGYGDGHDINYLPANELRSKVGTIFIAHQLPKALLVDDVVQLGSR